MNPGVRHYGLLPFCLQFTVYRLLHLHLKSMNGGFPGCSVVKNLPTHAGDVISILDPGRSPGERHGNPLQYSCLENSMGRGAWRAIVHRILQARILEWVAYYFSRVSSWPRNRTGLSCTAGGFFTSWATQASLYLSSKKPLPSVHPPWFGSMVITGGHV